MVLISSAYANSCRKPSVKALAGLPVEQVESMVAKRVNRLRRHATNGNDMIIITRVKCQDAIA